MASLSSLSSKHSWKQVRIYELIKLKRYKMTLFYFFFIFSCTLVYQPSCGVHHDCPGVLHESPLEQSQSTGAIHLCHIHGLFPTVHPVNFPVEEKNSRWNLPVRFNDYNIFSSENIIHGMWKCHVFIITFLQYRVSALYKQSYILVTYLPIQSTAMPSAPSMLCLTITSLFVPFRCILNIFLALTSVKYNLSSL